MKSLRNILMLGLLLTLAGVSAHAQTPTDNKMVITIPFDFSVGKKDFAAGEYTVRRIFSSGLGYSIQRTDKQPTDHPAAASFVVTRVETGRKPPRGRLVFAVSEGRYVLAQVWATGNNVGGELSNTSWKRKVAQVGTQTERVTLIAQQQ